MPIHLSFHQYHIDIFAWACTEINSFFGRESGLRLKCFLFFFTFSYLFAAVVLLTFFSVCFHLKNFLESIFDMENSCHGAVNAVKGTLALSFSLKLLGIFMHILGPIDSITLIWVSLKIYFPPAEDEYIWSCQFSRRYSSTGDWLLFSGNKKNIPNQTAWWPPFWDLNVT